MEQRVADGAGENASRQWLPIRPRPLNPGDYEVQGLQVTVATVF